MGTSFAAAAADEDDWLKALVLPPPPGGIGGGVPPALDMVTVEVLCNVCGVTINVDVGDVNDGD